MNELIICILSTPPQSGIKFLTPAEGELKAEECEICFHECVKNKGYALRCRMWLTPDIHAAKLRRVLNLTAKIISLI